MAAEAGAGGGSPGIGDFLPGGSGADRGYTCRIPGALIHCAADRITILPIGAGDRGAAPGADAPMRPGRGDRPALTLGEPTVIRFRDQLASPRLVPVGPGRAPVNRYRGRDEAAWRSGGRAYRELHYRGLWEGLDLVLRREGAGLVCSLEDREGARRRLDMGVRSADRVAAGGPGLVVGGSHPQLRIEGDGADAVIICAAKSGAPSPTKFSPTSVQLEWSTFLCSNYSTRPFGSAMCDDGDVVICGTTWGGQFPDTSAVYDDSLMVYEGDAFVCRLAAGGDRLVWYTVIGGSGIDEARDVALDAQGDVLFTAIATTADYPVTPGAYDHGGTMGGYTVATKLDGESGGLVWSALLGPSNPRGIAVLGGSNAAIVGAALESGYPTTTNALQPTLQGETDGFITVVSSDGSTLLASTYFGGELFEVVDEVITTAGGDIVIGGHTKGLQEPADTGFPITEGAYDTSPSGTWDAFLTRLPSSLDGVIWSTFLGGVGNEWVFGVQLDSQENVVALLAVESSPDYPMVPGCFEWPARGTYDSAVSKLTASGDSLLLSTRISGSSIDFLYDMQLDGRDNIYVVGRTMSTDVPIIASAYQATFSGYYDMYAYILDASAHNLLWGSYIGASYYDEAKTLELSPDGALVITGLTLSEDAVSTPGAYDETYAGGECIQVLKLSSPVVPATVSGLRAERRGRKVELAWTLGGDLGADQVRVWRARAGRERICIGDGVPTEMGVCRYVDPDAPEADLAYWLEISASGGEAAWYGPALVPGLPVAVSRIGPACPNPFNPKVSLPFELARAGTVTIGIYDLRGRLLRTLLNGPMPVGRHQVTWDGRDGQGRRATSGTYLCVMQTQSGRSKARLSLLQ